MGASLKVIRRSCEIRLLCVSTPAGGGRRTGLDGVLCPFLAGGGEGGGEVRVSRLKSLVAFTVVVLAGYVKAVGMRQFCGGGVGSTYLGLVY